MAPSDIEKLFLDLFGASPADALFAHYTTAETARKILSSRSFWLRNCTLTNDSTEIRHGTQLVREYFNSPAANPFFEALGRIDPTLPLLLRERYNRSVQDLEGNTFIGCLTRHDKAKYPNGQLSMWRAYGGSAGVALILKGDFLESDSNHLETYTYPVLYKGREAAFLLFDKLRDMVVENEAVLRTDPNLVVEMCLYTLHGFGISAKDPAFEEEAEYRFVYRPGRVKSDYVLPRIEMIGGVLQIVQSLPLVDPTPKSQKSLNLFNLLEQVLIGPCAHPEATRLALVAELVSQGVGPVRADKIVTVSGIPLRSSVGQ